MSESNTIKLIVIEDYKIFRVGLIELFKRESNLDVVGEAEDGEEGLVLINRLRPDVVVLDLGLPKMSGIEVAQQIKAMDSNIKIIILTSHEAQEEVAAALRVGANAYCLKDIASTRLLEVIKTVHEGAAWLDPAVAKVAFNLFNKMEVTESGSPFERGVVLEALSEREYNVLKRLVEGKSNAEIADELCVSIHTIKAHVGNILQKMAVEDRVQAAVKAIKEGIV